MYIVGKLLCASVNSRQCREKNRVYPFIFVFHHMRVKTLLVNIFFIFLDTDCLWTNMTVCYYIRRPCLYKLYWQFMEIFLIE